MAKVLVTDPMLKNQCSESTFRNNILRLISRQNLRSGNKCTLFSCLAALRAIISQVGRQLP